MTIDQAVELLKIKDDEAFEYIYNITKAAVYGVIINIVKNQDVAADLMQDTYIKMIKYINSYNNKYNFKSWVVTIAKNTAIDHYRIYKKEMLVDISESEHLFPTTKSSADDTYNANHLLSLLDDDEREIVILYAIDDYKHKEIAKITGKPLGTVLWIYNKAIKKLKSKGAAMKL